MEKSRKGECRRWEREGRVVACIYMFGHVGQAQRVLSSVLSCVSTVSLFVTILSLSHHQEVVKPQLYPMKWYLQSHLARSLLKNNDRKHQAPKFNV